MKRIKKKAAKGPKNPELMKKLGERLKKRRKELGFENSEDFAYDKEINRSQYGKYEAGSIDMRLSTLSRIIGLQGLSFREFFQEDSEIATLS